MDTDLKPGDRVRLLVHVPSADWLPYVRPDFPVGSEGTVAQVHCLRGYGVLLDDDPDQLPAYFDPGEIGRADG